MQTSYSTGKTLLTRVTQQAPHVEQELLAISEHICLLVMSVDIYCNYRLLFWLISLFLI